MHLITGFAGTDHVTSANDGVRNAQIFGNDRYIIGIGQQMRAQQLDNNTIRIYDGYGVMDGRFFEIPKNTYEDVTISNGKQGKNRIDLICVRYEKNSVTGIETTRLVVIKGTATSGAPSAPAINEGNILNGDSVVDFPLYTVKITNLNITSVLSRFSVALQGFYDEVKEFQRLLSDEVTARENAVATCLKLRVSASGTISDDNAYVLPTGIIRINGDIPILEFHGYPHDANAFLSIFETNVGEEFNIQAYEYGGAEYTLYVLNTTGGK